MVLNSFSNEVLDLSTENFFEQELLLDQLTFEITDMFEELNNLTHSYEIYAEIDNTITKCGGVTKSLEIMFGENFSSTASMEAEAKETKKNLFVRIWEKIKALFRKIVDWFKGIFDKNRKDPIAELKKIRQEYGDIEIHQFPYITIVSLTEEDTNEQIKKQIELFRNQVMSSIEFSIEGSKGDNSPITRDLGHFGIRIRHLKYDHRLPISSIIDQEMACYNDAHNVISQLLEEFKKIIKSDKFKTYGFDENGNYNGDDDYEERSIQRRLKAAKLALKLINKAAVTFEKYPSILARYLKIQINKQPIE